MTICAFFAGSFTRLPSVMAFQAINLQCFAVLLMGKCHFPIRGLENDRVWSSESTCNHQTSHHESCENKDTHQLFHLSCFLLFLGICCGCKIHLRPHKRLFNSRGNFILFREFCTMVLHLLDYFSDSLASHTSELQLFLLWINTGKTLFCRKKECIYEDRPNTPDVGRPDRLRIESRRQLRPNLLVQEKQVFDSAESEVR